MKEALRSSYGLLIDGKEVPSLSGETMKTYNPATGEVLAEVAKAGTGDLDLAVQSAQKALQGEWRKMAPQDRAIRIFRLAELLKENLDSLAEVETKNSGKAIFGAKGEIMQAIEDLIFYAGAADKVGGKTIQLGRGLLGYTLREPVGVCAQVVPWNYPLMMATWKVAPALAAGCTFILKPASATPVTALLLGELALEAGIPPGVMNVLPGPGASLGEALVTHKGIRKVTFTGETTTGKRIMALASQDLKRVTLELGGKSPNIVFASADLEAAAAGSVYAIYYNAGQSCDARSRIIVEEKIYLEFLALFVEKAKKLKVGDPMDPQTQVGALISRSHLEKVHSYVETGVREGARVALGGEPLTGGPFAGGTFYPPTVLADVSHGSTVSLEEIFGPVVTFTSFKTEEEAVAIANGTEYGLAGTVWTGDPSQGHRVASVVDTGLIGINTPFTAYAGLPFGGYKASGFGREMSLETLNLYTEEKCVLMTTRERPVNPFRV